MTLVREVAHQLCGHEYHDAMLVWYQIIASKSLFGDEVVKAECGRIVEEGLYSKSSRTREAWKLAQALFNMSEYPKTTDMDRPVLEYP